MFSEPSEWAGLVDRCAEARLQLLDLTQHKQVSTTEEDHALLVFLSSFMRDDTIHALYFI